MTRRTERSGFLFDVSDAPGVPEMTDPEADRGDAGADEGAADGHAKAELMMHERSCRSVPSGARARVGVA